MNRILSGIFSLTLLIFSLSSVQAEEKDTRSESVKKAEALNEAMVACAWSKTPTTALNWLSQPAPGFGEEHLRLEKSPKTLLWLRMVSACDGIFSRGMLPYDLKPFAKLLSEKKPEIIGNDNDNVWAYQCLRWFEVNGQKKIFKASHGIVVDGKIVEFVNQLKVPNAPSDDKKVFSKCQYIQPDGSLIDA